MTSISTSDTASARAPGIAAWFLPRAALLLMLGVVLSPQFFLLKKAFSGTGASFFAEAPEVVWGSVRTTLLVGGLTVTLALLAGSLSAFCVTRCEFPLRRALSVLLCLPFAIPPLVTAGVYRSLHDAAPRVIPSFDNAAGGALLLSLALYPWVYLPLKVHFAGESDHYRELASTLGMGRLRWFFRIRLGLLTPPLVLSGLLVLMEVLSDFGVASLLGLKTVSVLIHDAMFSMYRPDWAAQLSLASVVLPILAVALFMVWFRKRAAHNPINRAGPAPRRPLGRGTASAVAGGLSLLLFFAFGMPVLALAVWSFEHFGAVSLAGLAGWLTDSLTLVLSASVLALALAGAVNLAARLTSIRRAGLWHALSLAFNLNYAVPTVMLGVALLFLSADLPPSLLSNTRILLIAGAVLTYLCFAHLSVHSGLTTLNPRLDDLARCCPMSQARRLFAVYFPLLRGALACALLLVVVNVAKDVALSEVLQPFGFRTLTMRVFEYAKVGMLEESAIFSLCLILLLLYPVVRLDKVITGTAHAHA